MGVINLLGCYVTGGALVSSVMRFYGCGSLLMTVIVARAGGENMKYTELPTAGSLNATSS